MIKLLAIDTETTGPDFFHGCKPYFVSIASEETGPLGFEWDVNPHTREVYTNQKDVQEIKRLIAKASRTVFHNAPFDVRALSTLGIHVNWDTVDDTHLYSHAVNSEENHGLKSLSVKYLRFSDSDDKELEVVCKRARTVAKKLGWRIAKEGDPHFPAFRKSGKSDPYWKMDAWLPKALVKAGIWKASEDNDVCKKYALNDAIRTLLLMTLYNSAFSNLREFYELNRRLLPSVYEINEKGFPLDRLKAQSAWDKLDAEATEEEIRLQAFYKLKTKKPEINTESPIQMKEFLLETCKLKTEGTTKTGQPSLDKKSLLKMYASNKDTDIGNQFLKPLLFSRKLRKAQEYISGYMRAVDQKTGTLHTSINPVGTGTVRVVAANPNTQNIGNGEDPELIEAGIFEDSLTTEHLNLRRIFTPPKNKSWFSFDYSQLQLRIFAFYSEEESLIQAFRSGLNAHTFIAMKIFKIDDPEKITKGQKRIGKNVNFGFIFGASPSKIEKTAGRPGLWKEVTSLFPNAHKVMQLTKQQIYRTGKVYTMGGYPLSCSQAHKGINYIVQGTEGEIVKEAWYQSYSFLKNENLPARVNIQVHDQLDFENDYNPDNELPRYMRKVWDIMEDAGLKYGVETPVECEFIRPNFGWNDGVKLSKTKHGLKFAV